MKELLFKTLTGENWFKRVISIQELMIYDFRNLKKNVLAQTVGVFFFTV